MSLEEYWSQFGVVGTCLICGASPMTADCNNANCDKKG